MCPSPFPAHRTTFGFKTCWLGNRQKLLFESPLVCFPVSEMPNKFWEQPVETTRKDPPVVVAGRVDLPVNSFSRAKLSSATQLMTELDLAFLVVVRTCLVWRRWLMTRVNLFSDLQSGLEVSGYKFSGVKRTELCWLFAFFSISRNVLNLTFFLQNSSSSKWARFRNLQLSACWVPFKQSSKDFKSTSRWFVSLQNSATISPNSSFAECGSFSFD